MLSPAAFALERGCSFMIQGRFCPENRCPSSLSFRRFTRLMFLRRNLALPKSNVRNVMRTAVRFTSGGCGAALGLGRWESGMQSLKRGKLYAGRARAAKMVSWAVKLKPSRLLLHL
jgi:hypothetical protein